jgi:hypothetical protein
VKTPRLRYVPVGGIADIDEYGDLLSRWRTAALPAAPNLQAVSQERRQPTSMACWRFSSSQMTGACLLAIRFALTIDAVNDAPVVAAFCQTSQR